jgi:hypothetical protein
MPYFFPLYILYLLVVNTPLNKVAESNELIREAENSFLEKNYILALVKYRYLNNSLQRKDSNIQLNLAHCYFLNQDTAQARKYYLNFVDSNNEESRGIACQQLGVLAFQQKNYIASLNYFKKSLQALPLNEDIRYNYELVKKINARVKKPKKQNKPPEKPKEIEEKLPPPPSQEQAETTPTSNDSQQKSDQERQDKIEKQLKKINLSQEKAQMILDALKNSEAKYIQQQKKVPGQNQGKNYPDW